MGRDELSEEYYDDDDMWLSDDDWDEREPPSEETLSKLRECFPRMADDAKLKIVMALAELSDDGELLDLMGACIDDSRGIDTSDVRDYDDIIEENIDRLADVFEENLDIPALLGILGVSE